MHLIDLFKIIYKFTLEKKQKIDQKSRFDQQIFFCTKIQSKM
jgi:hypothetical protein